MEIPQFISNCFQSYANSNLVSIVQLKGCYGSDLILWSNVERVGVSEKECGSGVGDDVDVEVLPNDLHRAQVVGGDGYDEDAVLVVVRRLHLGEVVADVLVLLHGEVGEENGLLHTHTALAFEVLDDITAHLVAFDVVHHKK